MEVVLAEEIILSTTGVKSHQVLASGGGLS